MDPPGLIERGGKRPPELGWRGRNRKAEEPSCQAETRCGDKRWAGLGGCSGIEGPAGSSPGWADAAVSLPRVFAPRNLPRRW